MNLDFTLKTTQTQKLILTHQMQQSLNILQMSSTQLEKYIEEKLLENPLLEAQPNRLENEYTKNDYKDSMTYEKLNTYDDYDYNSYNPEKISPFYFLSKEISLKNFLQHQLLEIKISAQCKAICEYIIENIDDSGYCRISLEEISKKLKIYNEDAQKALNIIQNFEPHGVGARNIQECLHIQINQKELPDKDLLHDIVDNHLQLIADHKYQTLSKRLHITLEKTQQYDKIIKSLEPKPGRSFYTEESIIYVKPDAYIKKIQNEYHIILNDELLPTLSVNSFYHSLLENEMDEKAKKYIHDQTSDALMLIQSIRQRESTLYLVLEKILELQKDFFEKGFQSLKPMSLKDIAGVLEVHESTVSRAIREKYIATDIGIIRIKDLFTRNIPSTDSAEGISISSQSAKEEIKRIIEAENKKKPLSDQKISTLLKEKGMDLSRRTVAKYREELGIRSSSKRKEFIQNI